MAVAGAFEEGHQGGFVADLLSVLRPEINDLVAFGEEQREDALAFDRGRRGRSGCRYRRGSWPVADARGRRSGERIWQTAGQFGQQIARLRGDLV